ncbi:MAG: acetoacetate--CoA ligase [Actinomycetales bacterium]|nr:acetoacetate--CoA ligase [Actinomycetales bacterium]
MSAPTWSPEPIAAQLAQIASFERFARSSGRVPVDVRLHEWSVTDLDGFWSAVWDFYDVVGAKGEVAYRESMLPKAEFFPDARLNIAENMLREWPSSTQVRVIESGEVDSGVGIRAELSRDDLVARVAQFAAVLRARGVGVGDRIVLILPVGIDALVSNLGALAMGAVVSSVAPEFGAPAILDRIDQLDPSVLVAAADYNWNGSHFDRMANLVETISGLPSLRHVLLTRVHGDETGADPIHEAAMALAGLPVTVEGLPESMAEQTGVAPEYARLPFDHPAYVLFSSGTTGKPKCLIHRAGGVLLKHLTEVGLHSDCGTGDRMMFYSTTSWMMWNWQVSSLATGAALVMHDGAANYPDLLGLITAARLTGATHVGVGARLLDQIRHEGLDLLGGGPLPKMRMILVTGSPLSESTAAWLAEQLGPQVMINPISGGTDLIGVFVGGDPTRPYFAGEMTGPNLGCDIDVLDDDGNSVSPGGSGELVCRKPFPTVPLGIWGDDDGSKFYGTYFDSWPGIWAHGDHASWTENGGIVIHGRSDATLNAGGVRIGTAEIYAAIEDIREITDAISFAQDWDGDTRIVLIVTLADGHELDADLRKRIKTAIRTRCSPRHVPQVLASASSVPRTRTGKLSEVAVRDAVNGRPVQGREALANPGSLDEIAAFPELRE